MLRPTQQNQAATTLRRSHRSVKRLRDAAAPDTIEKLTAELEATADGQLKDCVAELQKRLEQSGDSVDDDKLNYHAALS